jgi:hypothetical protein
LTFKMPEKKLIFNTIFLLVAFWRYIYMIVGFKVFLIIFACW